MQVPPYAWSPASIIYSESLRGRQKLNLRKRVGVILQRGCIPCKGLDIYLESNRVTFHDFEQPKNGMFVYFKRVFCILVFMWRRIGEYNDWKQGFDYCYRLGKRDFGYRLRLQRRPWRIA